MLPAPSTATTEANSCASAAGPPSPEDEQQVLALPATVVMIPSEETLRIRPPSAMNRLPARSTATLTALNSWASVAGPPSPEEEQHPPPLPATVVRIPSGDTLQIRAPSARNKLPEASTATPCGCRDTLVAAAPSLGALRPPPATVVMIPSGETLRTPPPLTSTMNRLPAPSAARANGSENCASV